MIYVNPNIRASYRDGYVIATFICDTAAELPATNYLTGYTLEIGCTAHVIENATDYEMQSDGTWCEAHTADLSTILTTLSDVETRLTNTETDAQTALNYISELKGVVGTIINQGAKNVLNLTDAATTTDNGVTFTVNPDFTITCTGLASATAWLHVAVTIPKGVYVFKGMPEDGGSSTYRQELRVTPTGAVSAVNDSESGNPLNLAADYTGYYNIRVASGYDFGAGVTIKPMIALEEYLNITPVYVPYAPTNRALYDLIRTYHP